MPFMPVTALVAFVVDDDGFENHDYDDDDTTNDDTASHDDKTKQENSTAIKMIAVRAHVFHSLKTQTKTQDFYVGVS